MSASEEYKSQKGELRKKDLAQLSFFIHSTVLRRLGPVNCKELRT